MLAGGNLSRKAQGLQRVCENLKRNRRSLHYAALCRKTIPGKVRGTADSSAALGMTKGRAKLPWKVVAGQRRFSSPWVGRRPMTTPVEMTILLQLRFRISPENGEFHPHTELSSRPERSVVARSAVSLEVLTRPLKPNPLSLLYGPTKVVP
jgi:hypothetical protein